MYGKQKQHGTAELAETEDSGDNMAKTIKQIAEEIGVTKQAVFKKIKQEPLSIELEGFISTIDGKMMVELDGEKLIKQAFKRRQKIVSGNFGSKEGGNKMMGGGNLEQVDAGTAPISEKPESTLAVALQVAVDALTSQLEAKDRQLEEKDRQIAEKDRQLERQAKTIEELATSLAVAQHTAQAAQALHAGTIQRQIEEGPAIRLEEPEAAEEPEGEPVPEPKEKKGFFSRLFGR